jgi:transcriptional regulator with XRE-family HTH domain
MISKEQCRAARAWLNLKQEELAEASGVSVRTLIDFEKGIRVPHGRTLRDVQKAFEAKGVQFVFDGAQARGILFDRADHG